MAMAPVHNPPKGPVTAPINGMFVGKSIYVFGKIDDDARRFQVLLMCGRQPESNNIALSIIPSFSEKKVSRNSIINGSWGEEENAGDFPFTKGDRFSFKLTCVQSHFVIEANDKPIAKFEHRVPFTSITHVHVAQQCQAMLITSEIAGAEMPALNLTKPVGDSLGIFSIPFYNVVGRRVVIAGIPTDLESVGIDGTAFNFLMDNGDTLLHYNPRSRIQTIVLNSKLAGQYGKRESDLDMAFPFVTNAAFQTTISFMEKGFVVAINGVPAFTYDDRVGGGMERIRNLQISTKVKLQSITYY